MENLQPSEPNRPIFPSPANQIAGAAPQSVPVSLKGERLPGLPPCPLKEEVRTKDEIDRKMTRDGFPELERHWREFKKLGIEPSQIDADALAAARSEHMSPFFSRPLLGAAVVGALAFFGASRYVSTILPELHGFPRGLEWGFKMLSVFNYAFLITEAATYIQRRIIQPMERIMALDVGFMLAKTDFRSWFDASEKSRETAAALSSLGINAQWDNQNYRAYYRLRGEHCERLPARTPEELVHAYLREFLGQKDSEQRKFVPGRYSADLIAGKRTVTEFVLRHQRELELSRKRELPLAHGIRLLSDLLETSVRPGSKGAASLREKVTALSSGENAVTGMVEAQIWERNPWRDLTHQEEFYSSASLRGVKAMGRGMKGRLGTFGYLRNKCISALDFTSSKGRVVRARLAAASVEGRDGRAVPVLFVDGVEGSNAINPRIVQAAIEDYARACGFKAVLYNRFVHNQIPRRFVRHIAAGGVPAREVSVSYVNHREREYLDAFGLPLEPFEYAIPRGVVIAHAVEFERGGLGEHKSPSLLRTLINTGKRNALWLLLGETLAYAGTVLAYSTPELLLPCGVAAAAGIAAHWWYQLKSVRKT